MLENGFSAGAIDMPNVNKRLAAIGPFRERADSLFRADQ